MEYILNNTNLYFTIGHMNVHIEHYLWGRVEFKTTINHIMVNFGSLSLIPPPPLSPSLPPCHHNLPETTHNHSATSPSPLLRDVGSTINTPGCTKQTTAAPAPPLSKGMWVGTYLLDRGIGDGKRKGGPKEWEARPVHRKNRLRHLS